MAVHPSLPIPVAPVQLAYGRYGSVLAAIIFTAGAASEFVVQDLNGQGLALGMVGACAVCVGTLVLGVRQQNRERRFQRELAGFIATRPAPKH